MPYLEGIPSGILTNKIHMKTLYSAALACLALATGPVCAQVLSTFDADTEGWFVEGDGDASWSSGIGLPAGSLQVNDDATGDLNILYAPPAFLGDWSAATALDSLACDHRFDRFSGTIFADRAYFYEISGPGGRARALVPVLTQPELAWEHRAVALVESDWMLDEGTWNALIANVTSLSIVAEYVDGDEVNHFDNFRLDISPVRTPQDAFQCSDFELNTFEGWTFEGASGSVSPGQGNPGTALRISDIGGPISRGIAPPAFWGDWTPLDGNGLIGYDVRVSSGSNILTNVDTQAIIISGPFGSAELSIDPSVVDSAIGQWSRIESRIDEALWTVTSGTWDSLLMDINRIDIRLEFINGIETVYFDNFCLGNPCTATPTGLTDSVNTSGVLLSWDSQKNQGAIGYRVGGKPEGASGFSFRKVVEPNTSFFVPQSRLLPDTTYIWVLEAVCTTDGSVRTDRAADSFATPALPAARMAGLQATLAPNPTTGPLRVELEAWTDMVVLDGQGRRVRRFAAGRDQAVLDLSGLAPGLYWLQVRNAEGAAGLHPVQVLTR